VYEHFVSAGTKQLGPMVAGGIGRRAGLHRRQPAAAPAHLSDPRIRINSRTSDIVLLVLLGCSWPWAGHLPLSAQHLDGSMMMKLAEWSQRIVTFRAGAPELLAGAGWPSRPTCSWA
jgi:nitrate reductase gamma subunit